MIVMSLVRFWVQKKTQVQNKTSKEKTCNLTLKFEISAWIYDLLFFKTKKDSTLCPLKKRSQIAPYNSVSFSSSFSLSLVS